VQSGWGGTVERAEHGDEAVRLGGQALAQLEETPLYARADLVGDSTAPSV
jgi:hypothetical protein